MNVNIINERFPEYQNMSQQEFDNLTDQYKQKYAPLSEKEKKLLGRYYTDTMKSIYTPRKMTSFDTLESYLEKSNLESITNDNLINIPYNVFVQLEERYEYEQKKKKGKTANFEKIQIYLHRYIKDLKKASKGFTLLYDKKLNNMNAYDTIEYIETIIQNPKFSAEHPSFISIYLVYNPGSKPFHATCIFEFESFYYEFSHYGGGSNVGSIIFETYPEKGNNIYEYGHGVLATKICDEEIPQNIANNITLQTLLNISMFWWSKTDACNIRTFPGSCTGLVETATILTNLNNVCNNVAVNKSVILMGFKRKKSRLSSRRRSPRKSSRRRSPRKSSRRRSPRKSTRRRSTSKSSRRRSPRKSTRRRSTSKSSKRRNPRKSTRRSPRKSPKRRSPRKSPKRRSPRKYSKRRSPRKSSKRRSPRN